MRADERELLRGWLTMPLDVDEATRVRPGDRLWLRSLVGGPRQLEQRDRRLSLSLSRLDLLVAPLLPDGHPVAAGGAARERILAMLDDCEYRRLRAEEEGNDIRTLPDPVELRRRLGLPEQRRR